MSGAVYPLKGSQRDAVDPLESVWLSASAGTGKTQVLSARVLRLLLQPDVHPSNILCLTFTKAGATEMAERVSAVLANWVRMPDTELARDLKYIGASFGEADLARARSLFASVLDCPGGGLRIDTIHAFSQYLLATFPEEAGIQPGSRAMEDRERELLSHEVLTDLLLTAQKQDDQQTLDAIAELSRRKGPDAVRSWLMRCASARELWEEPGAWREPMRPRVDALLGLTPGMTSADVAKLCADDAFDIASLQRCVSTLADWGTKTALEMCDFLGPWIGASPERRLATIDGFFGSFLTKEGSPKGLGHIQKRDPDYEGYALRVRDSIARVRDLQALLSLAEFLTPALQLGRKFALLWEEAKQREGYVDFDDQIRQAAQLLSRSDVAPWIRYKMDRQFDHVLIDEAQDTNEDQWAIIFALIDDYFSGEGARDGKMRTIFTVGDYKQAIFRFQGTSPENFEAARRRVYANMAGAADNAEQLRSHHQQRRLQQWGLGQSFRTTGPILDFVDRAIAHIGHGQLGLKEAAEPHVGLSGPGMVAMWNIVRPGEDGVDEGDEGEDGWLPEHDRELADRIARQVRQWLDDGFTLAKGKVPRNAGPGDIMVLVRKRRELAGLIVARLYAAGVPVAGVDRLRLGAPLAVKDLMAAIRFAAQPLDDLNLANLLASPLVGWSQDDLLAHCYRPSNTRLWSHLRQSREPKVVEAMDQLRGLLARADYEPPQALLHWMLIGPWQGRRKLVSRLGAEANDPINELLNAAHAYAVAHTPSLQGFIKWFDAGDGELKRESDGGGGLVRVMTVHGSKGLQAPIVILADATGKPDTNESLSLVERLPGLEKGRKVPLPGVTKDQRIGPIAEVEQANAAEMMQEHWRLLYVAMTRAEEALFIGGTLGKKAKEAHPESWYAKLEPLFPVPDEDAIWGNVRQIGSAAPKVEYRGGTEATSLVPSLPAWANLPVGPEPRPPRPLSPSAAGDDQAPDPPLPPDALRNAARRGVLLHKLLERLPQIAEADRRSAGISWLERQASEFETAEREAMVHSVLSVISTPDWADIFGEGSLAEVPLAAVVGGQVIAGTVDRLLVAGGKVKIVDFKTSRRPPESMDAMPDGTVKQMAAYHAALSAIYPDKVIDVAVLYTHAPRLFAIPEERLERYKTGLQGIQ